MTGLATITPKNPEYCRKNGKILEINLHAYHYAGNNPVKLTDPTGAIINGITSFDTQNSDRNKQLVMGPNLLPVTLSNGKQHDGTIGNFGCLFTAMVNIGNTIRHQTPNISSAVGDPMRPVSDYAGNQDYYAPGSVVFQNASGLLKAMTGKDFSVSRMWGRESSQQWIQHYNDSTTSSAYLVAEVDGPYGGSHFINVLGVNEDGSLMVHDTYGRTPGKEQKYDLEDVKGLYIIMERNNDRQNW
jgi:hypothetical protein